MLPFLFERHAHQLEHQPSVIIRFGGGHDGHLHAAYFVDLVVFNFREDQLILQSQGVITTPIERLG